MERELIVTTWPERKSKCLAVEEPGMLTALAWFKTEEQVELFLQVANEMIERAFERGQQSVWNR